ncbi:MAG TPA: RNA-binding protein [Xanthobacteraceae bacterium]|nr:RNA-binding protein [Xanthobacteraceae bacterium]
MNVEAQDIEGVLDDGPHARERGRLCVATRTVHPVADLIRFVVGPDGEAVPDIKCRLPGRGVWVTGTRAALEDAIKRRVLARGFKRDVRLPADLVARTERLLLRAVLDALAIAGKAGLVAAGFTKAATALESEEAVALLHAAEASPDGVRKLDAVLGRHPGNPLPVIEFLTSAQLDLALGRPNVIHAALLAGSASDTFLSRSRRLERYRTGGAGDRSNQDGRGPTDQAGRLYGRV